MARGRDYGSWGPERIARYTTHNELAQKNMLLFSMNVNSLNNKTDQLADLFRRIGYPYIICFQECKHGSLSLPNYHQMIKKDRQVREGGGVAMLVHKSCKYKILESPFIEGLFETQCVEVSIGNENIRIYNVYRPPQNRNKTLFLDFLKLLKIDKSFKKNIVVGDINFDLNDPDNSDISATFAILGMATLVDIPTRCTEHSETVIDHAYSSLKKTKCLVLQSDISDHFGLAMVKENLKPFIPDRGKTTAIAPRQDSRSLDYFVNYLKWMRDAGLMEPVLNNHTTEAFSIFQKLMNEAVTICCEPRPRCKKFIPLQPWFTKGMYQSRSKKQTLLEEAIKSKDSTKWSLYKTYRNSYNRILRRAKILHYQQEFDRAKGNGKLTWSIANELTGRNRAQAEIDEIEGCQTEVQKCETFNNFYLGVAQKLSSKLPPKKNSFESYLPKVSVKPGEFKFRDVSPKEVGNIIKNLASKTSTSHDYISNKMLKKVCDIIKVPMAHLVNLSMKIGFMPTDWKLGKVTPIFKSSDPTLVTNYRPISILPSLSKCVESAVYNQVIRYLESNNILFKDQYGFRRKHSAEQLLLKLHKAIFEAKSDNKWACVVYLDLAKAFDCCNIDIMIHKLNHYGLPIKFFTSYLRQRAQYVQIGNTKSEIGEVLNGIHQGTILGPLLYLLYCNDLPQNTLLSCFLFADDTSLFNSAESQKELFETTNKELDKLSDWFASNKLSVNAKKTRFQIFNSPGEYETMKLYLMGSEIERCWEGGNEHYFKLVGIRLDEGLTYRYQVEHVRQKIAQSLSLIIRSKAFLSYRAKILLYNSLIQSHLLYGVSIWGGTNAIYIDKLISLQKKAIRLVVGAPYNSHTKPLFARLQILEFGDLYKLSLLKIANSKINPTYDTPKSPLECFNIQPVTVTRSSQTTNLVIPFCSRESHKRLCIHQVPFFYNKFNYLTLLDNSSNITDLFHSTCIENYRKFVCLRKKCHSCKR